MSEIKLSATSPLQPAIDSAGGLLVGKMHRIIGGIKRYKSGFGLDLMLELAFNNPRDSEVKTKLMYFTSEMTAESIYRLVYARLCHRLRSSISQQEMQDEDIGNVISYVNMILSDIGWELAAITVNPSTDVDRPIDIVQQTSTAGGQDILFLDDMVIGWIIGKMCNMNADWDVNHHQEIRQDIEARLLEILTVENIVSFCAHTLPLHCIIDRSSFNDHVDRLRQYGGDGVTFSLEWLGGKSSFPAPELVVAVNSKPVAGFQFRVRLDPAVGAILDPMAVYGSLAVSKEDIEREYSNCWVGPKSIQQSGVGVVDIAIHKDRGTGKLTGLSDSSDSNDPTET